MPKEPETGEIRSGDGVGRGKRVREAELRESGHLVAETLDEPAGNRVGRGHRPVPADNRAHAGLEGVPGAGRARPFQVVVEARDPAGALDDVDQLLPLRKMRPEHELVGASSSQFQHAGITVEDDRPPVRAAGDVLDTGNRTSGEMREHRGPVEPAVEWQAQRELSVCDQAIGLSPPGPQRAGRRAEDVAALRLN